VKKRARVGKKPRPLTEAEREQMMGNLMWSADLEGVVVTRAEAEAALERALARPLLNLDDDDGEGT